MKRLLATAALMMTLTGCSGKVDFDIDNPTDHPITLRVDEQRLSVPAHSSISLSLAPGQYRLHNDTLGDVRMIVYADGRGGLINPTLAEYVIASEEYGGSKSRSQAAPDNEIELDEVMIEGPYRKVSGLFIERDWHYGPRKAFPEVIYSSTRDDITDVKAKIFSVPDFIAYLETATEQPCAYAEHNPDGYKAPPPVLTYTPAALPELHPLFEAQATPMREHYAHYLQATDAKQQRQLKKLGRQVRMNYADATSDLSRRVSVKDREQETRFIYAFERSRAMSAAILPVALP